MTFRLSRYSNINGNNFMFSWSYLVKDTMEIFLQIFFEDLWNSCSWIGNQEEKIESLLKKNVPIWPESCWEWDCESWLRLAPFQSWMHFKSVYFCPNCPEEEEATALWNQTWRREQSGTFNFFGSHIFVFDCSLAKMSSLTHFYQIGIDGTLERSGIWICFLSGFTV